MTSFWVKNTTDKTINFKATITKFSTMGSFDMTLPFAVAPKDSVLAIRVGFKKNISPALWFKQFIIFPVDSVIFNDPNKAENWIKEMDEKGYLKYTFNLTDSK
ncbi:MAG: hypothetical protein H0W75_02670 [Chitinophagaceae bacterium]|nr:hypothetical protein [Chitinophagaceae bacterium]